MEIVIEKIDDIVIFQFVGSLDTGTSSEAEAAVINEFETQPKKMIFNLEKTTFVSSAGLRVFLLTAKRIGSIGGQLKLCSVNDIVKDILEISGFITILDVQNSLDEAKSSF